MKEQYKEAEFEFTPFKKYNGVDYELGELTPNGTALYISTVDPPNKGDWPTCIEVDQNYEIVWSNLQ